MEDILSDTTKFTKLGHVSSYDNTSKIEKKFQTYLRNAAKDNLIDASIIKIIKPIGSERPRLYGLPKIHKDDVPLRPVLSTVKSSQRPVANFLKTILAPAHQKFTRYCVRDSFTFANEIKDMKLQGKNLFLCSYDIKSLYTNIPIDEVIRICCKVMYEDEDINPPSFSRDVFADLLKFATCSIEFSFNNVMYRQDNGLGMGNVLSAILSDIYVGFHELKIFSTHHNFYPSIYRRYVDDTFAIFSEESHCTEFLNTLNSIPSLQFTIEKQNDQNELPFLDVLIQRSDENKFKTSIYRKPTFSGNYMPWTSFAPINQKLKLIDMLTHRAFSICSTSEIASELNNIRSIFKNFGYQRPSLGRELMRRYQILMFQSLLDRKKILLT